LSNADCLSLDSELLNICIWCIYKHSLSL